jgi:hypothetical protein
LSNGKIVIELQFLHFNSTAAISSGPNVSLVSITISQSPIKLFVELRSLPYKAKSGKYIITQIRAIPEGFKTHPEGSKMPPNGSEKGSQAGLRVEYRPLDALIPFARNARTHSDEQVGQIAASTIVSKMRINQASERLVISELPTTPFRDRDYG